jgi:hypothetical protein
MAVPPGRDGTAQGRRRALVLSASGGCMGGSDGAGPEGGGQAGRVGVLSAFPESCA